MDMFLNLSGNQIVSGAIASGAMDMHDPKKHFNSTVLVIAYNIQCNPHWLICVKYCGSKVALNKRHCVGMSDIASQNMPIIYLAS